MSDHPPPTKIKHALVLSTDGESRFAIPVSLIAELVANQKWRVRKEGICVYGTGDTIEQALEDFKAVILDYFDTLIRRHPDLNVHQLKQMFLLSAWISQENVSEAS